MGIDQSFKAGDFGAHEFFRPLVMLENYRNTFVEYAEKESDPNRKAELNSVADQLHKKILEYAGKTLALEDDQRDSLKRYLGEDLVKEATVSMDQISAKEPILIEADSKPDVLSRKDDASLVPSRKSVVELESWQIGGLVLLAVALLVGGYMLISRKSEPKSLYPTIV